MYNLLDNGYTMVHVKRVSALQHYSPPVNVDTPVLTDRDYMGFLAMKLVCGYSTFRPEDRLNLITRLKLEGRHDLVSVRIGHDDRIRFASLRLETSMMQRWLTM